MKYLYLLPLLGAAALLTSCAVEPAYVEGGPVHVYGSGPVYGPGPGYYAPEPVYGGTTVVSIEHDRYVDHDRYYNDRRDRNRHERRDGNRHESRGRGSAPARYGQRGVPSRNAAAASGHKPDRRKKDQKRDQH